MTRRWERLALIVAAVIIIASAVFYVYVGRFPAADESRIEDTTGEPDGSGPVDETPPSATGDMENPS
ncbi:putative SIGNAL PEPTIDE protein [Sinorhizobium sojae CCBAU 05684]|uniref:Putative SIGNAL PEPTIDE protein n=1 Tax=Sinorhizobium sojae CCBAU 05684 TaxID=716928 RepID=A0A249PAL7_9HYPH|nr:hypothetical protein [Sinorhizobium sojae]ASY62339.1 putative SIGNAL PEPTIDE protein [Sinorhizobium sojae CCBAU 05684]